MKHWYSLLLLFATCLFSLSSPIPARAQAGNLDPTFGNGGIVTVPTPFGNAALQLDGKIVVVTSVPTADGGSDGAVARYRVDGSLDRSFGFNGIAIDSFGLRPYAIALQPDGKIVASEGRFQVVRYNRNGSVDTTFGDQGLASSYLLPGSHAFDIAVQPDGKIVLAGDIYEAKEIALVRFNPDGSLDETFSSDGIVVLSLGTGDEFQQILSIAIQPDHKIVVAGHIGTPPVPGSNFVLARFKPNGEMDETFGNGGEVNTNIKKFDQIYSVMIQPDGKIVAAGWIYETHSLFGLARYNPDGSLDSTFGTGGTVMTSILGNDDTAYKAALQSDGKIIAVGSALVSGGDGINPIVRSIALARYSADGSLDLSFGDQGKVVTDVGSDATSRTLVLEPDGKIVLLGNYGNQSVQGVFARYLSAATNAPVLQTEANSNRALALDSVTLVGDSFSVTNDHNFSADHRTRVILFATNLALLSGEGASSVSVQARKATGEIYVLPVEYVGAVPDCEWLTEVVVKLPDGLANAGDVQVSLTLHGDTSNQGLIFIK